MSPQPVLVRRDDDVLDALGPDTISAGQLAARMEISVKEAVALLIDLRERGLVERRVRDKRNALAEWKAAW